MLNKHVIMYVHYLYNKKYNTWMGTECILDINQNQGSTSASRGSISCSATDI